MNRALAALLVCLVTASCGGESPTAPSPAPAPRASSTTGVLVVFTPIVGTYTAQLNGQTYTASGGFTVNLPVGTHEVTGSFVGQGFGIGFSRIGGTGVESSSIRSLTGPAPDILPCQILYLNFDTPNTRRNFRMQFRVTSNSNSACQ